MDRTDTPIAVAGELEYVIRPSRPWVRVDWAQIIEHRDLLFLLVRRDLVARYKQTILGPAWHVVQPLVMALVFSGVFSRVAFISTEGVPRVLFYLCSLLAWNYFSLNFSAISGTFTSNAQLFGKVYFPRLVVPLAVVISNLVAVGLQLGVFLAFFAGFALFSEASGFGMSWAALLLPLLVLQTAAFSLGLGLIVSAFTARFRDLLHVVPFVVSIWMFVTPVFYPLSQIAQDSRWVFLLNPMAPLVEAHRILLLGKGTVPLWSVAASIAVTTLVLLAGVMLFQRTERTVVDTI